ncbi:MAG: Tfp pilus assembly protein PilF [Pirellulaceae bacterium]|jgi:Tfp pilus assembly protein PilF
MTNEDLQPSNGGCDLPTNARWMFVMALTVFVVMAFGNGVSGKFIFDDELIVSSEYMRDVSTAFETDRPLLYIIFAINRAIVGLNPFWYHVVNISIHLSAALTLFAIVRKIVIHSGERYSNHADLLAFGISTLWAVHPLQTQSVTYVIQRGESLSGLCYLLCIYLAIAVDDRKLSHRKQLAIVLIFFLGLFCKPTIFTAPIALLLWYVVVCKYRWRQIFIERLTLFAGMGLALLVQISCLIRNQSQIEATGVSLLSNGSAKFEYLCSQPAAILHYLKLSIWPSQLTLDYAWPIEDSLSVIASLGSIVILFLIITVFALYRMPKIGFVLAMFFITLGPTSSFLPISDIVVEHRMYLALGSVVTLLVFALFEILSRFSNSENTRSRAMLVAIILVASGLSIRTNIRNADYITPSKLWSKNVQVTPNNARAFNYLGIAFAKEGRSAESMQAFRDCISVNPNYPLARINFGILLSALNKKRLALEQFEYVIRISKRNMRARLKVATTQQELGMLEEAKTSYENGLQIDPEDPFVNFGFASVLEELKEPTAAEAHFVKAIELQPHNARFFDRYAQFLANQGRLPEAITRLKHSMELDPYHQNTYQDLASALQKTGRRDEAMGVLKNAAKLFPREEKIRKQLAHIRETRITPPS